MVHLGFFLLPLLLPELSVEIWKMASSVPQIMPASPGLVVEPVRSTMRLAPMTRNTPIPRVNREARAEALLPFQQPVEGVPRLFTNLMDDTL